jgi:flap endonuclease-1
MGIKDFGKVIDRHAPNAKKLIPVSYFSGKRIAVDIPGVMYTYMAVARKWVVNKTDVSHVDPDNIEIITGWVKKILDFVIRMLKSDILPIMIFDGKGRDLKAETQKKRRDQRDKYLTKVNEQKDRLAVDPLSNTTENVKEMKRLLRNYLEISTSDFSYLEDCLRSLGIPCMTALHDAEQLCSMLAREGKVSAVYSRDSDNMAWQCPLWISEYSKEYTYNKETKQREQNFTVMWYSELLKDLDMTEKQFRDLCIMCGCDFNKNIKGVGGIKCFDLIAKYKSIPNLPENLDFKKPKDFDFSCLKYKECRKIFTPCPSEDLIQTETSYMKIIDNEEDNNFEYQGIDYTPPKYELKINRDALFSARGQLEIFDLISYIGKFHNLYDSIPEEFFNDEYEHKISTYEDYKATRRTRRAKIIIEEEEIDLEKLDF